MGTKVLQGFYFLIVLKFNHDSGRSQQKISFNIETLTDKFHAVQQGRIQNSRCYILDTADIFSSLYHNKTCTGFIIGRSVPQLQGSHNSRPITTTFTNNAHSIAQNQCLFSLIPDYITQQISLLGKKAVYNDRVCSRKNERLYNTYLIRSFDSKFLLV